MYYTTTIIIIVICMLKFGKKRQRYDIQGGIWEKNYFVKKNLKIIQKFRSNNRTTKYNVYFPQT